MVAIWRYDKRDYHGSPVVYHGMRLLNVEDNPKLHTAMVDYVRAVLDALGIRNGAMHSEVMATPRGPVLVEVCRGISPLDPNACYTLATRLLNSVLVAKLVINA